MDALKGTPELRALLECPQTERFHAEGSVWRHTVMALAEAAQIDPVSGSVGAPPPVLARTVLDLATLLHDVGKPAVTTELEPGVYSSRHHETVGADLVALLWGREPALRALPLGVFASVQAMVEAHMWTFGIDDVRASAMLKFSHAADPHLLKALWRADTRGRICDDATRLAEQVEYAELVLDETVSGPDGAGFRAGDPSRRLGLHPGGLVGELDALGLPAPVRRRLLRALTRGELRAPGALGAAAKEAEQTHRPGSLTYTIGLPGVGKSTWAHRRAVENDALVLSIEGTRRRERQLARARAHQAAQEALSRGRDVVLDATHLSRESRDVVVTMAERARVDLRAVYFDAPLKLSLDRQGTRPTRDQVPAKACIEMAGTLRWPTPDEYDELLVVDEGPTPWVYSPATRWLARR